MFLISSLQRTKFSLTRARRRKETLATPRIARMARIFFFALRAEILENLLENLWSLTAQKCGRWKVRCERWDFWLVRAWDSYMDFLGFLLRRSIRQTITLSQKWLFCLHFDFSGRSASRCKIEKREVENSSQNAKVGKKYCPGW